MVTLPTRPTILLTGATGTIGAAVRRSVAQLDAKLLFGTRQPRSPDERAVDFSDRDGLVAAFTGVDLLFLLLPLVPNKLQLAENAIWAARQAGVKQIVRSSGMGADAASPYELLALNGAIDEQVRASGLAWTILRPNSFMHNFINYFGDMIRGGALYLPQGEGATSLIDVADIGAAVAAILAQPQQHQGQIYTLTGPAALTNSEAMHTLAQASGRAIDYVAVDEATAAAAMAGMGLPQPLIQWMLSWHRASRDGQAAAVTTTVTTLTGQPPRTLAQFAQQHAALWAAAA